jgi:hypothetical protein
LWGIYGDAEHSVERRLRECEIAVGLNLLLAKLGLLHLG